LRDLASVKAKFSFLEILSKTENKASKKITAIFFAGLFLEHPNNRTNQTLIDTN